MVLPAFQGQFINCPWAMSPFLRSSFLSTSHEMLYQFFFKHTQLSCQLHDSFAWQGRSRFVNCTAIWYCHQWDNYVDLLGLKSYPPSPKNTIKFGNTLKCNIVQHKGITLNILIIICWTNEKESLNRICTQGIWPFPQFLDTLTHLLCHKVHFS